MDIILVGLAGSGKSYFANILRDEYGYKIIEIGDCVREASENSGMSPIDYAATKFKSGDSLCFVKMALNERIVQHNDYVFVGPRKPEELEYLSSKLDGAICISLKANYKTRYQRRSKQKDKKETMDLRDRDNVEIRWGIKESISKCRVIISNHDGNLTNDFKRNIKKILGK